jgi:pimeloyl-ACP methyl ester carboxylesterase
MTEKVYGTQLGKIHYWINKDAENTDRQLVFLPGLTADHRLFEKQIAFFERKYPVFVWDAPDMQLHGRLTCLFRLWRKQNG